MKTTTCKRCGAKVQFDEDKGMWLAPGTKGTQGRWCRTTPEHPVQVHQPDLDAEASATATFEVGDRVTYTSRGKEVDDAWQRRKGRTYTIVDAFDTGGERGAEYHCIEVTPTRNRHNPDRPDFFYGTSKNLRLVAKATYAPAE